MARWRGGGVSPLLWHNIFEVTKTELKTLLCCYPTSFRYDGGGVGGARDDLDAGDRGCEGQEAEQEPRQPRHRERHHDWPRLWAWPLYHVTAHTLLLWSAESTSSHCSHGASATHSHANILCFKKFHPKVRPLSRGPNFTLRDRGVNARLA